MKKTHVIRSLAAVALFAASGALLATPVILVADQERSPGGTLYTKFFDGTDGGPASTATWDWNGSVLTQTGGTFHTTRRVNNISANPSFERQEIVGLMIDTGASTVTATSFVCNEGTFGPISFASFCVNVGYGFDGFLGSFVLHNVGGNANCISKFVGGDDSDGGPVRGLSTHGAAGSCTAQTGIYERYTVSMAAGTLVLSNGIPVNTNGSIWMTFALDSDGDGATDSVDNCSLVANPTQCDSDADGFGNGCDGDMNQNNVTNNQDYGLFRQQLGQPSVAPTYNKADINCNNAVNNQDYGLFRGLLGVPPGPGAGP